ncbi:plasmid mobilization relaxosome protein MobC [Kribbella capetownensis]|uniref:Plasmid mobilization relaxosome protein MobC n=1 Tax=Kribbella capetownensis TaxID=1572659 RepID=A0A4R0IR23_9ACTN|nr:plasmid mobilization relaxosome protein MobC [Kribbella capetownensis]TCC33906.1 plasmid mobilization relaxosome protein MobC [Kribbella capetownensis]
MTTALPGRSGRRRRQPNAAGGRSVEQKVRLTAEEAAALRLKARRLGVSVPRLLVESALAEQETATDRRDLMAALFGLQRLGGNIANNVNQLAKKANATDEFPENATPVLAHIQRLLIRIDQALNQLGTPGGGAR